MTGITLSKKRLAVFLLSSIAFVGTANAQLMNRAEPLPGITSSGQPDAAALAALADEGFVAVIDLRGPDEDRGIDEQSIVESNGMRYLSLPVPGADAVTFENASALDKLLAEIDGPVLIHCASGNRAGGILALRERLLGASADDALALGLAAGIRSQGLQSVVEERLLSDP